MKINNILTAPQFKKSFAGLTPKVQRRIVERKIIFQNNPFNPSLKTHRLKGKLKNRWSFSITYSYRVLFNFIAKDKVIFYDVGSHKIYQ